LAAFGLSPANRPPLARLAVAGRFVAAFAAFGRLAGLALA
jgi:hypothetical protein